MFVHGQQRYLIIPKTRTVKNALATLGLNIEMSRDTRNFFDMQPIGNNDVVELGLFILKGEINTPSSLRREFWRK